VLASLAAGDSAEEILSDFPSLKPEDIQAAIAFAAASAEEDLPVPLFRKFDENQAGRKSSTPLGASTRKNRS
jgi:hypothetical protein